MGGDVPDDGWSGKGAGDGEKRRVERGSKDYPKDTDLKLRGSVGQEVAG